MRLCSIASGSSGNCIFAGSESTGILIDTGISKKKIEQGLHTIGCDGKDLDAILITHEHSDHIKGLGVFERKYPVPIYATKGTIEEIQNSAGLGKFPEGIFHEIKADEAFAIGDLEVVPFAISHDAAEPVGYRINSGEKSIAVATDMGTYDSYIIGHLQRLDALLLEANHDVNMLQVGAYPYYLKQRILGERGHLSNCMAGRLLCEVLHEGMQEIVLGHLSKENNYEALAYETVCSEVTFGNTPYQSKDFHITVARRDAVSDMIVI